MRETETKTKTEMFKIYISVYLFLRQGHSVRAIVTMAQTENDALP